MWQITVKPNHINIVIIMEFDNFYIASLKQSSNVRTAVMENGIASVAYNTNGKRYDLKR